MTKTNEILGKYISMPIEAKKLVFNIWKTKKIHIWWVVNYSSAISNWIKLFSQSIYSHTNFFDGKDIGIWAEDLEWILFRDYKNKDYWKFYYVSKTLNLDYLSFLFSFDYIESIFVKLWKFQKEDNGRFKNKFIEFCAFRDTLRVMEWRDDTSIENVLNMSYYDFEIPENIAKEVDWYIQYKRNLRRWLNDGFEEKLYNKYHNYLKEFLVLWFIKFIVEHYGKKYDLNWTLNTILIPWSPVALWQKEYFCSEFVSESFIYAWIYPFDINSKDPSSITPWDIMDMTMIFEKDSMNFYQVDGTAQEKFKPVWSLGEAQILKNYIIETEKEKIYFIRQKMWVTATSSLLGTVSDMSNGIISDPKTKKKKKYALWVQFGILLVLGYIIWMYSDSINLKTDLAWWSVAASTSVSSSAVSLFFSESLLIILKMIFVLLFMYVLIKYIIPYVLKVKSFIFR